MYDKYLIKENNTIDNISSNYTTKENTLNDYFNITTTAPKITSKYFDYYTVTKGDTLYKIAKDNNINPTLLAQLNGINENDYIYPNQVLLIPKGGTILYITAIGDTLNEIAKGLNTTTEELTKQNENIYLQPEQLIVYKYE